MFTASWALFWDACVTFPGVSFPSTLQQIKKPVEWLHSLPFTSGSLWWIYLEPVFLVDGWRTGVLNLPCFPLCALLYSWKCSAWSCMSPSETTKIWWVENNTRSQSNQLAIVIMCVLWLGKGLTETGFGKCRWSSRNHSNAVFCFR